MPHARTRIVTDGAIAGILGAVAVAIWFLAFDTARGHPLETPALLASTILHGGTSTVADRLLSLTLQYTTIHFIAFAVFGVGAALLLEAAEYEPSLTLSLAIFLGAFEVFFVAVVMFFGPELMAKVTWWSILVGNLMATVVMLSFFLLRHPNLARNLLGNWLRVMREGMITGLIGAMIVAAWFLLHDTILGQPLRTPALLGAALIDGVRDPNSLQVTFALVGTYTVLHFSAFIVFGLAAGVLMAASERQPLLLLGVFVIFACFEVFFLGVVTLVDQSLLESLGWWTIVVGNILALTGMLGFLLTQHRELRERLLQEWAGLELEGGD
jgi:hypothetical protein